MKKYIADNPGGYEQFLLRDVEGGFVFQPHHGTEYYLAPEVDARIAELESTLKEIRIRLHCAGRRPEECYEMHLIDSVL